MPTVTLPAPQPVHHRTANATPKAPVNDLLGNLEADAFGQPAGILTMFVLIKVNKVNRFEPGSIITCL